MEYVLVFLGAAIPWLEIALVIPLGIVRGLSPVWVIVLAFVGNMLTVLLLIGGFQYVKEWLDKRNEKKGKERSKRHKRGAQIMDKYGLPALSLAGPILTGTHIAAFIGLLLGASKKKTIIWQTISIGTWCLVFGGLTAMGFDYFVK